MNGHHALLASLRSTLFDIVQPLTVGRYNRVVPPNLHLPYPNHALILLFGHSKAYWPQFVAHAPSTANPLDSFVQHHLQNLLTDLPVLQVYWSHETTPGRLVGMQQMARASHLAAFAPEVHLCVHPVYGPWFALRAAVVVDMAGPKTYPPAPTLPATYNPTKMARLVQQSNTWEDWIHLRMLVAPNHAAQYDPIQMLYHYQSPIRHALLTQSVTARGWTLAEMMDHAEVWKALHRYNLRWDAKDTSAEFLSLAQVYHEGTVEHLWTVLESIPFVAPAVKEAFRVESNREAVDRAVQEVKAYYQTTQRIEQFAATPYCLYAQRFT